MPLQRGTKDGGVDSVGVEVEPDGFVGVLLFEATLSEEIVSAGVDIELLVNEEGVLQPGSSVDDFWDLDLAHGGDVGLGGPDSELAM